MSAFAPKGSAYGRPFPAYNCVVSRDQFIRRVAQHVSMVGITKRNKGMTHRYAVGTYGTKVEKTDTNLWGTPIGSVWSVDAYRIC